MNSPSAYLNEYDLSQILRASSSGGVGCYGQSPKGRIDELIQLGQSNDVQTYLGDLNYEKYGFGMYNALIALEGTSDVKFARVYASDIKYSTLNVNIDSSETETSNTGGMSVEKWKSESTMFDKSDTTTAILFVADYPGADSNSINIQISNIDEEDKTFTVRVFKKNSNNELIDTGEEFVSCSREKGKVDGYGNSTFIEDVINGKSYYIRAYSNPYVGETVMFNKSIELKSIALTGGDEGSAVTPSDVNRALELYTNYEKVNISIMPDNGEATESSAAIQSAILGISQERYQYGRQFHCVFSTPKTLKDPAAIVNWRETVFNQASSLCSLFSPWLKVISLRNNSTLMLPPSGFITKLLAITNGTGVWNSIEGLNRGIITSRNFSVLEPIADFDKAKRDILYPKQINPIITKGNRGIVVWGQKTTQAKASALDRINVRRNLDYIEYNIMVEADEYIGENNTVTIRTMFHDNVFAFLKDIKNREGLYDFRVQCDEKNNTAQVIDNNKLVLSCWVKPTKTIDWVEVNVVVTKSDAVLTEL